MSDAGTTGRVPDPASDWISRRGLAALLVVSERMAGLWARAGWPRCYEHGVENCARRPYSRQLVERERQRRWESAVRSQDSGWSREGWDPEACAMGWARRARGKDPGGAGWSSRRAGIDPAGVAATT